MSDFWHRVAGSDRLETSSCSCNTSSSLGDEAPGLGLLPEIKKLWLKFRTQPNLGCGGLDCSSRRREFAEMHIAHTSSCSEWGLCRRWWSVSGTCPGNQAVSWWNSLAEVFWGLTCCSLPQTVSAQVLCVKKEKVIKVIICLHLEVMLQCQRAEPSSVPGMSREALPWSLRPFLFTDLHSLPHCPLGETPCCS